MTVGTLDLDRPPATEALRAIGRDCLATGQEWEYELLSQAGRELVGAAFVIEGLEHRR